MVNMTLNIQLTDEQYADLMTRSFDAIVKDPAVIEKLQEIVIEGMRNQILQEIRTEGPGAIKYVYKLNGYNQATVGESLMEQLVKEAGENFANQIRDTIQNTMADMAQKVNVGSIIYKIVAAAIMDGATAGIGRWQEIVSRHSLDVQNMFIDINTNLGNLGRPLNCNIPGVIPPETPDP